MARAREIEREHELRLALARARSINKIITMYADRFNPFILRYTFVIQKAHLFSSFAFVLTLALSVNW